MQIRTAVRRVGWGVGLASLAALALVSCSSARSAGAKPKPGAPPTVDGCQVFPKDNPWNTDISRLPVHAKSATWINAIGASKPIHPDFGTVYNGAPSGIPYVTVKGNQRRVPVVFEYADESDPG